MSRAQRLTFLGIAVVIAVAAVVLIARGSATTDTAATPTASPAATTAPQEAGPRTRATPSPTARPVPTLEAGSVTKLSATEGQRVRFRVVSDTPEEIHVHGYDIEREVEPGTPLTVAFEAGITGVFEIEFHGSGEPIGRLSVQPR